MMGRTEKERERARRTERHSIETKTEHGQVPLSIPYLHKIIYSAQERGEKITRCLRRARVRSPEPEYEPVQSVEWKVFIIENRFPNSANVER